MVLVLCTILLFVCFLFFHVSYKFIKKKICFYIAVIYYFGFIFSTLTYFISCDITIFHVFFNHLKYIYFISALFQLMKTIFSFSFNSNALAN